MTVTNGPEYPESPGGGMSMDGMAQTPAHAKPARRDLLWVLVLILACGLLEVWASWLSIGAISGFPKLGRMTTGWILPVTTEAYWSAALFAWLAVPAGPKSAAFAKWSAAGMFLLSLAGQESDHLLAAAGRTAPPVFVVGFVTALPLISVALIAILIHLRQTDRDDAAEAVRARTEAGLSAQRASAETERIAHLEAGLSDLTARLDAAESAHADAEQRAAEALTRAEKAEAKLAAKSAQTKRGKNAQRSGESARADDITTEFRALDEMQKDPSLRGPRMGGELARRLNVSAATGRRLHAKLTAQDQRGESLNERSAAQSDERL